MEDINNITDKLNNITILEDNDLIIYIRSLNIDNELKEYLINLVYNDNYNNYLEIYNICLENNIELPPL